jgi:carbonic anhydrase
MQAERHTSIFVAALTIWLVSGCESKKCPPCECAEAPKEAAEHEAQPQYYALPGLDHGLLQSPVNILSSKTTEGMHDIEFGPGDGATRVTNLGHTVQVGFGEGLMVTFDGKEYEFKQLHFHTPSEHRIDGITYPMEIHLVHTRPGPKNDGPPNYLVVGTFYRMGEANRFLEEFLDAIPDKEGESAELKEVYFEDGLPPGFDVNNIHYYHYRGSLTTPPYTESVDWLVVKHVFEASREQILRINEIEGNNARRVQALYNRVID